MIKLTYNTFGRPAPESVKSFDHALILVLCTLFVITSAAITIVLNFFSLFAGVLITFLGRDGMRFKFLMLFDRIPAIAIALPVLFGYAIWHQSMNNSLLLTLWPMVAVWVLAGVSLVLLAVIGMLRSN